VTLKAFEKLAGRRGAVSENSQSAAKALPPGNAPVPGRMIRWRRPGRLLQKVNWRLGKIGIHGVRLDGD